MKKVVYFISDVILFCVTKFTKGVHEGCSRRVYTKGVHEGRVYMKGVYKGCSRRVFTNGVYEGCSRRVYLKVKI